MISKCETQHSVILEGNHMRKSRFRQGYFEAGVS